MISDFLFLQHPSVLGVWESDAKRHKAFVIQRVRPPTESDAELVGLKRIQESELTVLDEDLSLKDEFAKFRYIEGQGAYIREYFEAVIMPLLSQANENFTPTFREVCRTETNLAYVLEKAETGDVPRILLKLHSLLYNALAPDSEYKDLCLDFVVVEGDMFYDITPEFFNNLLLVYRFPFGIVLLYKCHRPVVLVIVTYSMKHKLRMFGSAGAGRVLSRLQRVACGDAKEKGQQETLYPQMKNTFASQSGVSMIYSNLLSQSTQQDASSEVFHSKTNVPDRNDQVQVQDFATRI